MTMTTLCSSIRLCFLELTATLTDVLERYFIQELNPPHSNTFDYRKCDAGVTWPSISRPPFHLAACICYFPANPTLILVPFQI